MSFTSGEELNSNESKKKLFHPPKTFLFFFNPEMLFCLCFFFFCSRFVCRPNTMTAKAYIADIAKRGKISSLFSSGRIKCGKKGASQLNVERVDDLKCVKTFLFSTANLSFREIKLKINHFISKRRLSWERQRGQRKLNK